MHTATATQTETMPAPTLPMPGDLEREGERVGDDIVAAAIRRDRNTMRAAKGGTHAKYEPRAWSYGGQVD